MITVSSTEEQSIMGGVVLYQDMVRQHFVMVLAAFFFICTPLLLYLMTLQHHVTMQTRVAVTIQHVRLNSDQVSIMIFVLITFTLLH